MKIAVCGSGLGDNKLILERSKELGKKIAKNKHILIAGGCMGYPYAALRGALLERGKVIAYSPGKDETEHKEKYNFSIDSGVEYIFTGLGIPERNIPLVKASDAVVLIDGRIGTLNEFTIAFNENKIIGVLKSGGITELIPQIADICNKDKAKKIIYEENPKKLLQALLAVRA